MKFICLTLLLFINVSTYADNWIQKATFPGSGRSRPFMFTIANKGYIGCGYYGAYTILKDCWEYNPSVDAWTQKADFGGIARSCPAYFSVGNYGYAGTGSDGNSGFLDDFWKYDPVANSWTQMNNFPGGSRWCAVGFTIGTKGYLGTGDGNNGLMKDFWEYDPISDIWIQKTDFAQPISACIGFSIGNAGYILGGEALSIGIVDDFWQYDPISNTWSEKDTFPGGPRADGVGFSICNYGYAGIGESGGPYHTDLYQYDPITDEWSQKTDFPGTERDETIFFSIGNYGYIGLGTQDGDTFFYDLYKYIPDDTCIGKNNSIGSQAGSILSLYYSTSSGGEITVFFGAEVQNAELRLIDVNGRIIRSFKDFCGSQFTFETAHLTKGNYYFELFDKKKVGTLKIIVP